MNISLTFMRHPVTRITALPKTIRAHINQLFAHNCRMKQSNRIKRFIKDIQPKIVNIFYFPFKRLSFVSLRRLALKTFHELDCNKDRSNRAKVFLEINRMDEETFCVHELTTFKRKSNLIRAAVTKNTSNLNEIMQKFEHLGSEQLFFCLQ